MLWQWQLDRRGLTFALSYLSAEKLWAPIFHLIVRSHFDNSCVWRALVPYSCNEPSLRWHWFREVINKRLSHCPSTRIEGRVLFCAGSEGNAGFFWYVPARGHSLLRSLGISDHCLCHILDWYSKYILLLQWSTRKDRFCLDSDQTNSLGPCW